MALSATQTEMCLYPYIQSISHRYILEERQTFTPLYKSVKAMVSNVAKVG